MLESMEGKSQQNERLRMRAIYRAIDEARRSCATSAIKI
jgi:hypothetical protein